MTTVFHTWLDGRFIQKYHNLKRKKIHKTKHVFYFPKGKSSCLDWGMALPLPVVKTFEAMQEPGPNLKKRAPFFWILPPLLKVT